MEMWATFISFDAVSQKNPLALRLNQGGMNDTNSSLSDDNTKKWRFYLWMEQLSIYIHYDIFLVADSRHSIALNKY